MYLIHVLYNCNGGRVLPDNSFWNKFIRDDYCFAGYFYISIEKCLMFQIKFLIWVQLKKYLIDGPTK